MCYNKVGYGNLCIHLYITLHSCIFVTVDSGSVSCFHFTTAAGYQIAIPCTTKHAICSVVLQQSG